MPALKNIRHEKFSQALFRGESAVRAYESAGYKVHQSSSSRLRWFAMVQERLAELQAEAAKNSEITVESLMRELEDARLKATSLNQLAAAVRATGEKIKLSGLSTQKIEVKQADNSPFTDDMSAAEILAIVAREKGEKAAWYMAMSFGLDPNENGIAITGRVIWEGGKQIEGEVCETSHASPVSKSFGPAAKSIEWTPPRKPARREIV